MTNCPSCNAAGKFSVIVEEQEDSFWRMFTRCKMCRKEIEIKIITAKEAHKLAGNRRQMHKLQPPRMGA